MSNAGRARPAGILAASLLALACPGAAASQREIYQDLRREAAERPEAAFSRVEELLHPALRDRILREAFATALRHDPPVAARRLPDLLHRPWIADAGFHPALALIESVYRNPSRVGDGGVAAGLTPRDAEPGTAGDSPNQSELRSFLLAAARRHPGVALREFERYREALPFGADILDEAARASPGEAAVLASGSGRFAQRLLDALRGSPSPDVAVLASLAARGGISQSLLERAAAFHRRIAAGSLRADEALRIARDDALFFSALARLRIEARAPAAAGFDSLLERTAQTWMRSLHQGGSGALHSMARLPPRDVYLLLAYGRSEQNQRSFALVFDRLLAPKARAARGSGGLLAALDQARNLRLRAFLEAAIEFQRLRALLALSGGPAGEATLAARAMEGIANKEDPLSEAVRAALLIDAAASPSLLRQIGAALDAAWERAERPLPSPHSAASDFRTLYALLAARLASKLPAAQGWAGESLRAAIQRCQKCFRQPERLDVSALFVEGRCVQRYYFYNDDDGVLSYRSFLSAYAADPAWRLQQHGAFIQLSGRGERGRRIDIYANVPVDIEGASGAAVEEVRGRPHILTRFLSGSGIEPSVVAHRGHSYHAAATIEDLTPRAGLVYLGSCNGIGSVAAVVARANTSHVIATRATGSHLVNDPLLKALNDVFLRSIDSLDWSEFWRLQGARLARNGHFSSYTPPHENTAAIFLNAWENCLLEDR